MPKGNRGGKRTASTTASTVGSGSPLPVASNPIPVTPTPVTPPTLTDVAKGNILPKGGTAFSQFESMTDDQKADVITNALGVATPFFLDDSGLQKLAYFTGMNDKPQVVSEQTLNSMAGQDIWRSVKSTYNPKTDIGYTSKDIYNQIATGDFTMYSDSGGSVHGKAIYFDVNKGSYGSGSNYTVMHAKLAPTAKVTSEDNLRSMWSAEVSKGTKLARAISSADRSSQLSLFAIAKGYDAYIDRRGTNYNMILNRRALVLSSTTF